MLAHPEWILPHWPAPARVLSMQTTRAGGVSHGIFASLNLGGHVGDNPADVAANRGKVLAFAGQHVSVCWMQQVHGVAVQNLDEWTPGDHPVADAVVSRTPGRACTIMTADCLPVLFCDRAGTVVGAAHAGWRSLCGGVLEATLRAMACPPGQVLAWLGPAIGPAAFEVGDEVRAAFMAHDPSASTAFVPASLPGKWLGNLVVLARQRLLAAGVQAIYGGTECTVSDPVRFFSYRRDGQTGRMASLVWLA